MRKFLLIFFFPLLLNAQDLQTRYSVEKSFVLLKNDAKILPITHLDTVRCAVLSNAGNSEIFKKSIARYTKVFEKNSTANLFFVLIDDSGNDNLPDLKEYLRNKKYVLCFFGREQAVKFGELVKNASAVIFSSKNDSLTYDYCGQLVFGAFSINNKLTDGFLSFPENSGLPLFGGIRFKYTIPAEVGIDSAFVFSKIDSIVNFAITHRATPGCQIFVAKDQKVFFYKSYGFHTYDSAVYVKNTDLYDLASVTKIAAAAPCMMLLYQQKRINLDDKFKKYWHKFRFSNKKDLTLIDAMTHQGRLTPWIPFWKNALDNNGNLDKKVFSNDSSGKYNLKVADGLFIKSSYRKEIFKQIKKSPLLNGKKYKYSDLSFYIYPQIVEKLTGESFENCLNENFYSKLGANSLCFNPLRFYSKSEIVPTEYDKFFRKQLIHGYVHDEGAAMLGGVSGHAGLFGNANDLAKLMQMYLNYGQYGGERFINAEVLKKWTSYQFVENGNRRAIIFDKPLLTHKERGTPSPLASGKSFGHSGFTGTFAWADPENGLLFVFLSNRVYPTRENKKLLKYNIRTNIHTVLYQAIAKN